MRRYSSRPVPSEVLLPLLDAANRAPSGFNLQPWHFIVVQDPEVKRLLHHIALEQVQVAEAPVVVVFVSVTSAWKESYDAVLRASVSSGLVTTPQAIQRRKTIRNIFDPGPFGLLGFARRLSYVFLRLGKVVQVPLATREDLRWYMRSQTMLSLATFLLAAESVGLATCPLEGFDEERLKRLLAIPKDMSVPAIVSVGYPVEGDIVKRTIRIPLQDKLHFDVFQSRRPKSR